MKLPAFLIAAPHSGSGKTTVSLAIMAALSRRGLILAPFKCGPDFIDPGYHTLVTGRPSINLDAWMCSPDFVAESFARNSAKADLAIIEGVMGLFDGLGASPSEGSSAQIAAITGAPVVLVLNARGMAASAAALIKGFVSFDPEVRIAGVIFNNVGSRSHAGLLEKVMEDHLPEIAVFGCIPRDESLEIPSRHLGLVTAEDNPLPDTFIDRLAEMAERCLDLERLQRLKAETNPPLPPFENLVDTNPLMSETEGESLDKVRIAVARDAAFCFVYPDNLRLLEEAGAELVEFSPLADSALPDAISGLYLPGGYPELYAAQLSANRPMKEAIMDAVGADMPVYAECGGFVYLTDGIETFEGRPPDDFVGIIPVRARMLPKRKALGYRQAELVEETIIGNRGTLCRGHEFHYSETAPMPDNIKRTYNISRQGILLGTEGYCIRNCLASYLHLHFGSNPQIAPSIVKSCRKFIRKQALYIT